MFPYWDWLLHFFNSYLVKECKWLFYALARTWNFIPFSRSLIFQLLLPLHTHRSKHSHEHIHMHTHTCIFIHPQIQTHTYIYTHTLSLLTKNSVFAHLWDFHLFSMERYYSFCFPITRFHPGIVKTKEQKFSLNRFQMITKRCCSWFQYTITIGHRPLWSAITYEKTAIISQERVFCTGTSN